MSLLNPNLQAFHAITKTGTVHSAARELNLTQTAVTQRIRALEKSLAITLFTRSRKGMLLTPEGNTLLRYVQSALELEGATLSQISGSAIHQEIRTTITGPTSIIRSRVIPGTSGLLKSFPELLFTYHLNDFDNWLDELRKGTAQFAVIPRTQVPAEMESKLLKPEFFALVGPKKWKSRSLAEIVEQERIIDFDQNDPMTMNYLKKFHLENKITRERHYVNNTESLMELIEAGHGYGVLALEFVEKFTREKNLVLLNQGRLYEHHMALCWYHRPEMPKYFQELIRSIK